MCCASILRQWREQYEKSGKTPAQEWQEMYEAGQIGVPPPSPEFCCTTHVFKADGETQWAEEVRQELFPEKRIRFREFL